MKNRKRAKRVMKIVFIIVICAVVVLTGAYLFGNYQMRKIPDLTFEDTLKYTTKNNPDALITVGIIKDGEVSYKVYGENGKELPSELHTYEIGSLTKTFTGSLISKAVQEGKINLSDPVDKYLNLPKKDHYPTIEQLLTHTSGYDGFYFAKPMVSNFFTKKNDFYNVTKDMILSEAADNDIADKEYSFKYSNFGYAMLGLVLEKVYGRDYTTLMNEYVKDELKLSDTKLNNTSVGLKNAWEWNDNDAYMSAGALLSNISDMLSYTNMQIEGTPSYFADGHKVIKKIDASTKQFKMMDINEDEIGMAWLKDDKNNIIWHNGATSKYNSYLGFNPETKTGVVILSNLAPGYRIPATVMGVKLLKSLQK